MGGGPGLKAARPAAHGSHTRFTVGNPLIHRGRVATRFYFGEALGLSRCGFLYPNLYTILLPAMPPAVRLTGVFPPPGLRDVGCGFHGAGRITVLVGAKRRPATDFKTDSQRAGSGHRSHNVGSLKEPVGSTEGAQRDSPRAAGGRALRGQKVQRRGWGECARMEGRGRMVLGGGERGRAVGGEPGRTGTWEQRRKTGGKAYPLLLPPNLPPW